MHRSIARDLRHVGSPIRLAFAVIGRGSSCAGAMPPTRGQGRNLAAGGPDGLCQVPPRRGGDFRQRPRAAGPCARASGSLAAERVWDLAQTPRWRHCTPPRATPARSFAASRRPMRPGRSFTIPATRRCLSLAVLADGTVYAGTGPNGQVVNLSDPKHPASRPGPKVQYIWDLAADAHGNLYAATGPDGQLWKRSADGKWSLVYDSKATHLLCLAIGPDGSVYAGGDGEGLIYRVSPDGKATILFDAPAVRGADLALGRRRCSLRRDGGRVRRRQLVARLAVLDAGGRDASVSRRAWLAIAASGVPARGDDDDCGRPHGSGSGGQPRPGRPAPPRQPGGGSAAPRPIAAGDNAVYRLDADGVPREVLRVKALVHALAWADNRLLVGTGPEGQLYEVRDRGEETAPLAKLDSGQILSLLVQPDGAILIGTGDPGSVVRLAAGLRGRRAPWSRKFTIPSW